MRIFSIGKDKALLKLLKEDKPRSAMVQTMHDDINKLSIEINELHQNRRLRKLYNEKNKQREALIIAMTFYKDKSPFK